MDWLSDLFGDDEDVVERERRKLIEEAQRRDAREMLVRTGTIPGADIPGADLRMEDLAYPRGERAPVEAPRSYDGMSEEDRQVLSRAKGQMSPQDLREFAAETGWPNNWEPVADQRGQPSAMIRRRNPDNSWSFAPAPSFNPDDAGEGVREVARSARDFDNWL